MGQFEQEIRSPSAAGPFVEVVARAEVMDRQPLSYLVRVWNGGAWEIFDGSQSHWDQLYLRGFLSTVAPLAQRVSH